MKLRNSLLGFVFLGLAFIAEAQAQIDIRGQIDGRVVNEYNSGVKKVNILLLDLTTLETQISITNQYGYFQFGALPIGNFYLVQVDSSRYFFQFPTQAVNLDSVYKQITFQARDFPISLPKAPERGF